MGHSGEIGTGPRSVLPAYRWLGKWKAGWYGEEWGAGRQPGDGGETGGGRLAGQVSGRRAGGGSNARSPACVNQTP